ncbi:MAG: hypothetical protein EHM13_10080 [Acidobacteria bacterium]|nr:MAG: hypothetical protein EHM13_10080 [Acidobacteriota bacterium]
MENWSHATGGWTYLSCYLLSIVSALVPWFNAEVLLLAFSTAVPFPFGLAGLVLAGSAGQMTGKIGLYWAGRGTNRLQSERVARALDRWRDRLEHHPSGPLALIFTSAILGFPPFYAVTLFAGAIKFRLDIFLVIGTIGRVARFAILLFGPHIAYRLFR